MKTKKVDLLSYDESLQEVVVNLPKTTVNQVYDEKNKRYSDVTLSELETKSKLLSSGSQYGIVKPDQVTLTVKSDGLLTVYEEDLVPQEIYDLVISSSLSGTEITLNWSNPTQPEYLRTTVFYSNLDITNYDYSQCLNNANVLIDSTDNHSLLQVTPNSEYYFKIFTVIDDKGSELYSKGIASTVNTTDLSPPPMVDNLVYTNNNPGYTISWSNPEPSNLNKVTIRYKEGSYPTNISDGILLYEGSGESVTFDLTGEGVTYYFRVFTTSINSVINEQINGAQLTIQVQSAVIWTVVIDENNSNTYFSVSYQGDNVDFTHAENPSMGNFNMGSWGDKFPYNDIKPFAINHEATEFLELNPNNFRQLLDGTAIDTTTTGTYNVTIRFPKVYWKFDKQGSIITINIANKKVDNDYDCFAHKYGEVEYDYIYISAYPVGALTIGSLPYAKSQSNGTPYNTNITAMRTIIKRNAPENSSDKCEITNYYQYQMLQILYTLLCKNLHSQSVFGIGYSNASAMGARGTTYDKGMYYGNPNATGTPVKIFGIENLYGGTNKFIEGFRLNANTTLQIKNGDYALTEGWDEFPVSLPLAGWVTKTLGTNKLGFFCSSTGGSNTTYYADNFTASNGGIGSFGGGYAGGQSNGMYALNIAITQASSTGALFTYFKAQ